MKGNKKLIASLVLLIVSAISFGIGIYLVVAMLSEQLDFNLLLLLPLLIYLISISVSYYLNRSYRKSCCKNGYAPRKLSTVVLVLSCFVFPPIVLSILFVLLIAFFAAGGYELKTATVTDVNGNIYNLKQEYPGSRTYKDQYGNVWETNDGGISFSRITNNILVKDKAGEEHTLTPTWGDGTKQFYNDEKGNEFVSEDGEQTFESVIKKITVDGEEYTLKPRFPGTTTYYVDQNGDNWEYIGSTYVRCY